MSCFLRLRAKVHQQRADMIDRLIRITRAAVAGHLLHHDDLLANGQPHSTPLAGPGRTEPTFPAEHTHPIANLVHANTTDDEPLVYGVIRLNPVTDQCAKFFNRQC